MIIISGIILLAVGACLGYQIAHLPKIKDFQRRKAIESYFTLKANDYTYMYEMEDSYILSIGEKEYRIKFSMTTPLKVVYAVELETVE